MVKAYTLLLQIKDAFFKVVEIGLVKIGDQWTHKIGDVWWVGSMILTHISRERERKRKKNMDVLV